MAWPPGSFGPAQAGHREVGGEDQHRPPPLRRPDRPREGAHRQRVARGAAEGEDRGVGPVVVDDPDRDRVAHLPADRPGEGVVPDRPPGVADDRRGAVPDAGDLELDAEVGAPAAEVLADLGLDLAPAEGDAVLAWHRDLVPPGEELPRVAGVAAVAVVA